ncbi:hypothetical protein FFLO_04352 [Filobasidium floriforme]|uniref:DNA sliding clamp PCNA n=1 Tax=Filobasidium floriforme TaxID=5210 RepID=A0A8K0JIY3_9TREE|nr:hypothetical protein FFLO_04352 [Filobasidium floriforme]
MDNSHVALVTVELKANEFEHYRCDRNIPLGISLASLTKILKCAKDTDELTLKANDDADTLGLVFQNGKSDRLGEYEMKLMDIDQEHLGIPDTSYDATVTLSSAEFARICRDLSALGESVRIDANKDGVRFTCEGEIGNGSVLLKPSGSGVRSGKVKKEKEGGRKKNKVVGSDDEEEEEEDDVKPKVEDSDEEAGSDAEQGEDEEEEEEEEDAAASKKRKAAASKASEKKTAKKAKVTEGEEENGVSIVLQQAVSLTFSLKYLQNFAKSAPLSSHVVLNMSNEVPLLVAFEFEQGHINFYLAPKASRVSG